MPDYISDSPLASDACKKFQTDQLGNNIVIPQTLSVDHIEPQSPADPNEGKHNYVTLIPNTLATTTANEAAIGAINSSFNNLIQLFFRQESAASGPIGTLGYNQGDGFMVLPSGIMLKWGRTVGTGFRAGFFQGPHNYPTNRNQPVFTNVFVTFLEEVNDTTTDENKVVILSDTNYAVTGFEAFVGNRTNPRVETSTFDYLTIGSVL